MSTATISTAALAKTHGLGGNYPESWDAFIGQEQVKRQLMMKCKSARLRNEPLKHHLFAAGEGGVGKTALALLVAKELGSDIKVIAGKVDAMQARIALSGMRRGDVLFYDEIQQGGKQAEFWLLHLLNDGVIAGPNGPEKQPEVTVLAATTDKGSLSEALISRFVTPTIAPYTEFEATKIAELAAKRIFPTDLPQPSHCNLLDIACATSFNPRAIGKVLENLRDLGLCDVDSVWDGYDYNIAEALAWEGLTPDGLTADACRYLTVLLGMGGQAGGVAIAERLQEPGGVAYTERLLMEKDMLARTRTGRQLTGLGITRAKELANA